MLLIGLANRALRHSRLQVSARIRCFIGRFLVGRRVSSAAIVRLHQIGRGSVRLVIGGVDSSIQLRMELLRHLQVPIERPLMIDCLVVISKRLLLLELFGSIYERLGHVLMELRRVFLAASRQSPLLKQPRRELFALHSDLLFFLDGLEVLNFSRLAELLLNFTLFFFLLFLKLLVAQSLSTSIFCKLRIHFSFY